MTDRIKQVFAAARAEVEANSNFSGWDQFVKDQPTNVCVVRVRTTTWSDKRGLHTKKSITFLRRQCEGYNVLEEDLSAIGSDEVLARIVNLNTVDDGVYSVELRNEQRDWESGYIEDYDYELVPVRT